MTQSVVALFDDRPFFEKAVAYGVQHGVLDQAKLDAIQTDAPKGMVQIARYFGSEFLRPELEKAKDRIVNMVSLTLQIQSGGDLRKAAEHLREHSFMSRSKAASDMLKALIVMPQNTHFGMNEHGSFSDKHIPQLAKWSLCNLAEYQAELAKRQQVAHVIDAAIWMADELGLHADDLEEAGCDAEAVIRTALLAAATKHKEMPDWVAFQKIIATLRKPSATKAINLAAPKNLPAEFKAAVEQVRQSVEADLPKILDAKLTPQKLFNQTPAFVGRYFWVEDGLSEVDHFDRQTSAAWTKATGGHSDDSSLLTLFLCIATGSTGKTLLTEKTAATLIRKIRKSGVQPELATEFIQANAPTEHQDDYIDMWEAFIDESLDTLASDHDYKLHDALSLLRRECNVAE
ncbi:MAG: hypothetical protein B7Y59_00750 [Burkholderiales bacterium 35-55-47]|jgi:hypothetical protein|uniref:hypothetical protein n=1 Tax=Limnohabitans sp. TaxID=1907725 RepID=UPI000BD76646|nr:hypothetical protein [Limnohabitans sp.]OYY19675.1 MAG: hypothetical protein B7Y59_00750 [Burkholderiales bacterium 35-55-47]OYZ74715.1 MAG: hypothetical protein B7Y06_04260 [Burkholderiales bacterium 24-55-52]OZB01396.1 MAG: hypothetical protein B7X62_00745 [Burkholderiales bacterium 39-55-53]HQR85864.1 hypothetical protein [Limnohabitans sp.]HQS26220.1 hypothetical protein [Limnohabitans sp.]